MLQSDKLYSSKISIRLQLYSFVLRKPLEVEIKLTLTRIIYHLSRCVILPVKLEFAIARPLQVEVYLCKSKCAYSYAAYHKM